MRHAIDRLASRGVSVVTLVSDVPSSKRAHYIGIDNSAAGRTAASLMGRFLRGVSGRIAIVAGSLLLRDHAEYGCMSLWCETPGGAHPFVFRERRVKGLITCAQLIYCRGVEDFVRFARPLGIYLARRRRPLVILDANGPVRGLIGKYFDQTMPKYFKGPAPPRLGDLAYTETALFGM